MTRILTTSQYLDTPRPNLQWLVHEQIPNPGIVLLEGPPKSGKSFLAIDLARSVAQGVPFLGWVTQKSRTLYLQFDTSELIWRQRLEKMVSLGVDLSGENFLTIHPDDVKHPLNLLNYQHVAWLHNVIESANPNLTIIDVFRETHNADENDSTEMKIVGDVLVNLFKGRSLVLVHHSKKIYDTGEAIDPATVSRGSSYLTGKVDSLWLLYRNRLYIQGRTSERQEIRLVQGPSGLWEKVDFSSPEKTLTP